MDMSYKEEEVSFTSSITLAGTLTRPTGAGIHAAVVLLTGSGPVNRDEEGFGWKPFRVIADHLTRRGFAVLRYDSRGVGGSGGTTYQYTLQDVAEDALAAIGYLKTREDIDSNRIGLLGHSQGGIVAPLCAARSDDVSCIICISGTGLPGDEVFVAQQRAVALASGATESDWNGDLEHLTRFIALIRAEAEVANLKPVVNALVLRQANRMYGGRRIEESEMESMIECNLTGFNNPWFRSFLELDPRPALAKVRCPILLVFGELDLQVLAEANRKFMAEALLHGGNSDFTIKTFLKANHLYQVAVTGSPNEYDQLAKEFMPGFLNYISNWLSQQLPHPNR